MTGKSSRWTPIVAVLACLLAGQAGAANWQMILSDAGRKMEIDRASIRPTEGAKILAWARIVFEQPMADARSGGSYRVIEALNRYDCKTRSFTTLKRVYRKDEHERLREEENDSPVELPVRSGSLDEKVLKIACRPSGFAGVRQDFEKVVQEANEAAAELRKANEGQLKKEVLKADIASRAARQAATKPAAKTKVAVQPKPEPRATTPVRVAPVMAARATPRPPVASVVEPAAKDVHWAYEGPGGPENWARLNAENRLCASGQRQSPIDIIDGIRVDLPPIEFRYKPSLFSIVDNGHTIEVGVSENGISLLGKDYRLVNLHFHRPAEERIAGKAFDMVAHLVHRADDGRLAVVALLLEPGPEHPVIQTLWNHLPLEPNEPVRSPTTAIDLGQLLPGERGYYTYMGSLTTPPCTEGVQWLVMKQPVAMSAAQIEIFTRFYRHNARPVQPTNGRLIKESR